MSVLQRVENFFNHTTEFLTNNMSIIIPIFTFSSFFLDIYFLCTSLFLTFKRSQFLPSCLEGHAMNLKLKCVVVGILCEDACSIYLTKVYHIHGNERRCTHSHIQTNTDTNSRGKWKLVRLHTKHRVKIQHYKTPYRT